MPGNTPHVSAATPLLPMPSTCSSPLTDTACTNRLSFFSAATMSLFRFSGEQKHSTYAFWYLRRKQGGGGEG